MDLLEQLKDALGLKTPTLPPTSALRQVLDAARRAKIAEEYPLALELLSRAREMATENREHNALALITLHQTDILIQQRRYDEAQSALDQLRAQIPTPPPTQARAQLSYVFSALGALAQARDDWGKAREHYEAALKLARESKAVGAEGRAMGHLAHTYLHEGNASYASHLLRESLPKLNMSGDIELSSYFVGMLGEAQIASGHLAEGEHMLTRALRLADHMQYRLYQRRWRLLLANLLANAGRFDVALNNYKQAFEYYKDRTPDAEFAIALCRASDVCLSLDETKQALDYARHAVEIALTLDDGLISAQAEYALGVALRANHDHADALTHLQNADAAYGQIDTREAAQQRVKALRLLAAAQTSADLPTEQVIETYRRSLDLAKRLGMRLELAHAYRDLGLLYSARGQYQQALAEWQQAQMIYEDEKAASQLARLYCDMGKARKALGQGSRALKDYESALLLLSSVDLETRGVLLSNAASAYAEGGDVESADDFFAESISIAHKLGDKQAEAMRRGNHGWFLVITGRARRATAALEQAVHVSRDAGLNLAVAVQTDNLGLAQMELSAFEAALHYHQQALELIDKLNQPRWEAIFKANAARALLALQRADEAEPLLNAALEYGRAHNDFEVLIRALCRRAELLMRHRGDAAGAGDLLTEAVTLARRADIRHLLADALALHSEQQALVGERDHAAALWGDAARLYSLLHHPLAKGQPTWLSTPETTK